MKRLFSQNISPVEFLILLSLKERQKHGYGVMKDLQEHFGSSWEVKSGTVYPALRRLEMRGLVKTSYEESEQKEYYAITPEGTREIEESLTTLAEEVGLSSRYFDYISQRLPKLAFRRKAMCGFAEKEPSDFDSMGNMIDMFSEMLPREAKMEWLEKWEKRLEDKLAKIRHMLSEERKKGGDAR
jgi:DNA-binding PadR family transcriptional regulator